MSNGLPEVTNEGTIPSDIKVSVVLWGNKDIAHSRAVTILQPKPCINCIEERCCYWSDTDAFSYCLLSWVVGLWRSAEKPGTAYFCCICFSLFELNYVGFVGETKTDFVNIRIELWILRLWETHAHTLSYSFLFVCLRCFKWNQVQHVIESSPLYCSKCWCWY